MIISPISSHLSFSRPQVYHHLRTWSWVIALYLSIPWSRVDTKYSTRRVPHTPSTAHAEYSIRQVQHTPSTAYTEYSIHRVQHTPCTAYTEYSIHRVQHTPSTAYTEYSIHRVQHTPSTVYTEYCIHPVMYHSKIDGLPLPASLSSLSRPCYTQFCTFPQSRGNQWIMSQLPLHLPPELPPPDWPPPSTLPISLDHGLQVHLWTCSIIASKCISKLDRLCPRSSLNHSLQVYL